MNLSWYRKILFLLSTVGLKGGRRKFDLKATRTKADEGDAGAQFNLGMRYHRASVWGLQLDALESNVEAHKWLQLAAAQGYKGSTEACERMTLGMNREEVAEGNRRAAAFVAAK